MPQVNTRMPDDLKDELEKEADRRGDTQSGLVRTAVNRELERGQHARAEALSATRRVLYFTGGLFVFLWLMLDLSGVGVILLGSVILAALVGVSALEFLEYSGRVGGVRRTLGVGSADE